MFYEKRSGGSIHGKERWALPSKQNTLYKLIRLLKLVPDGGEIAWERCMPAMEESGMRHKAKPGDQGRSRRLGQEEDRDVGPGAI